MLERFRCEEAYEVSKDPMLKVRDTEEETVILHAIVVNRCLQEVGLASKGPQIFRRFSSPLRLKTGQDQTEPENPALPYKTHVRLDKLLKLLLANQPRRSDTEDQRAIHRNLCVNQYKTATAIGKLGGVSLANSTPRKVAPTVLVPKTRRHCL